MYKAWAIHGHTNLSRRNAKLLADLSQHNGVNLSRILVPWEGEEVGREILHEPLVFLDPLNCDPFHRVYLE